MNGYRFLLAVQCDEDVDEPDMLCLGEVKCKDRRAILDAVELALVQEMPEVSQGEGVYHVDSHGVATKVVI
jgi:hypothetical protein